MSITVIVLLSSSILIPVTAGWVRFKKIDPAFYPFIFLLSAGVLNEILSVIIVEQKKSNAFTSNFYFLASAFIICYQFLKWQLLTKKTCFLLCCLLLLVWLLENLLFSSIFYFDSYFIITSSLCTIILSLVMINQLILTETGSLLRNPIFLICMVFVIFYTYGIIVEAFYMYGQHLSRSFQSGLFRIQNIINLLSNITYTFAIAWIPIKRPFLLPSS